MFCPNCGTQCADNAAFCSGCGSVLNSAPQQPAPEPVWQELAPQPVYQPAPQPVWQEPAPAWQPASQPSWQEPAPAWQPAPQPMYQSAPVVTPPVAQEPELPAVSKVLGLISMICGIVSLPMALAYGSGLFFGIAALVMSGIARNKAAEVGATNGKANTGKKLGIAGTIVGGIFFFIFVILLASLGESSGSSYYY